MSFRVLAGLWGFMLCFVGLASAADSSVVLTFSDGYDQMFSARLTEVKTTCLDGESVELRADLAKFEEVPLEEALPEEEGGKQGWGLQDLVGDMLRSAEGLVLKIDPETATVQRTNRPADARLRVDSREEGPMRLVGSFSRTDLGMGNPYRADDPLSLKKKVQVKLSVECP